MKIFKLKEISEFIRNGVTIKQSISSKEGIPITRIETISKGTIDFNKLGYANIFKIEKYKEIVYEKVEYEEPEVILQKLEELSKSIDENLKELKVMLDEDI